MLSEAQQSVVINDVDSPTHTFVSHYPCCDTHLRVLRVHNHVIPLLRVRGCPPLQLVAAKAERLRAAALERVTVYTSHGRVYDVRVLRETHVLSVMQLTAYAQDEKCAPQGVHAMLCPCAGDGGASVPEGVVWVR